MFTRSRAFITVDRDIFKGGHVVIYLNRTQWSAKHSLVTLGRNRQVGSVGVFILCVNLWRYSRLMRSSILILWGHGQSKSLFLQPRHSHVMRKPTNVGERLK